MKTTNGMTIETFPGGAALTGVMRLDVPLRQPG